MTDKPISDNSQQKTHSSPYSSFYGAFSESQSNIPNQEFPPIAHNKPTETSEFHANPPTNPHVPKVADPTPTPTPSPTTTQITIKPFIPVVVIPQGVSSHSQPIQPLYNQPNNYGAVQSPYSPQYTNEAFKLKSLKIKYLKLAKVNSDILPPPYRRKNGIFNVYNGFSYAGIFIYFAFKSNSAMTSNVEKKYIWGLTGRFFLLYFGISMLNSGLYEYIFGPAFDQQFAGKDVQTIEREINTLKETSLIVKY
jgi:hypothetical protein